jgi:hypothetical protein
MANKRLYLGFGQAQTAVETGAELAAKRLSYETVVPLDIERMFR